MLNAALDRAAKAGIVCVASVANDNSADSVYPAVIGQVIAVGATTNDAYRASFSNYGSEIDINAPGVDLWSPYPSNNKSNNRYGNSSGTSFSTAYVSGTVALIKSINSTETPAEADADLTAGAGKVHSPELKGGQLDVFKTVNKGKN
jgi:subtilisin family serine protease